MSKKPHYEIIRPSRKQEFSEETAKALGSMLLLESYCDTTLSDRNSSTHILTRLWTASQVLKGHVAADMEEFREAIASGNEIKITWE